MIPALSMFAITEKSSPETIAIDRPRLLSKNGQIHLWEQADLFVVELEP